MVYARFAVLALAGFLILQGQEPERLDLRNLMETALAANPEIRAAQKGYEAMAQRPRSEAALPDPMVGLGYNAVGYPLPGAGLGREPMANIGVMVTQEIPYPGKRGIRADVARKEAEAEWQAYRDVQLNVLARVKQAYYELQHSYQMLEVIDRNREVLQRMLATAENRYSVGEGIQQDVIRTQAQLSILEAQRVQIQASVDTAKAALNGVLNRPIGTPVGVPPEPQIHEVLPPYTELLASALENAPMVARDQKMIERSESALRLARKEWYPDLAVNAGYYSMGSMGNMYMLRADVRIPLWGSKQRAEITEQANTLAQSRRSYEGTQQNLAAQLKQEYAVAEAARRLMTLYADTVIPQANFALESALASYSTGKADFMTALQNFMTGVEYEMNYHQQMLAYHLAVTRLEQMSATTISHEGGRP
jgi:outer membrane protein TolC